MSPTPFVPPRLAAEVARLLAVHPAVAKVHYPGLESHPGHAIAARQQQGFGAMVSFELEGGIAGVRAFLGALQLFSLAESLGGVESLVAHPASMTHAAMDAAARERAGISETLVRLSVGIEDAADLVRDLAQGLVDAHAGFDADQHEVERIGPGPLDGLLALGYPVADVDVREVEADIGADDRHQHPDRDRPVGQIAEHEDPDDGEEQKDEGQQEACRKEDVQGVL